MEGMIRVLAILGCGVVVFLGPAGGTEEPPAQVDAEVPAAGAGEVESSEFSGQDEAGAGTAPDDGTAAEPAEATGAAEPMEPTEPEEATEEAEVEEAVGEPEAPEPEIKQGALVVISGGEGSGSGFIATIRDKTFLVTNIHVMAISENPVITTLEGKRISVPRYLYVCASRDLAIFPIEWEGDHLEAVESMEDVGAGHGDRVIVPGNEGGEGVVTLIRGKVTGIGPDLVETDAAFVPGNSGSPVIHADSGKVIGIASYIKKDNVEAFRESGRFKGEAKDREPEYRRFSFRLDGQPRWQQTALSTLVREWALLENYRENTYYLALMIYSLANDSVPSSLRNHPDFGYLFAGFTDNFHWDRGLRSPNNRRIVDRYMSQLDTATRIGERETVNELQLEFLLSQFEELQTARGKLREVLGSVRF